MDTNFHESLCNQRDVTNAVSTSRATTEQISDGRYSTVASRALPLVSIRVHSWLKISCAESQLREDCGGSPHEIGCSGKTRLPDNISRGETCSAHSLAAEAANSICDPVDAGVAHNSAHEFELIVTLNTGQFTLVEIHNGAIAVRVSAPEAQMIRDYLNANWPVGTVVQWIVVPPFQPLTPTHAHARDRNRFGALPVPAL
jgi:hypothetical protein